MRTPARNARTITTVPIQGRQPEPVDGGNESLVAGPQTFERQVGAAGDEGGRTRPFADDSGRRVAGPRAVLVGPQAAIPVVAPTTRSAVVSRASRSFIDQG